MKVTIGGELKDETFHLIPNHAATVTEGCTNEPSVPGGVEDFFGIGIDIFAQESGEDGTIVIPAKDGAVTSREDSEPEGVYKIAVTLTKRPAAGG